MPFWCCWISLKDFDFISFGRFYFYLILFLNIWIKICFNYPAVWIGWITCSFGHWIICRFENWSSKWQENNQSFFICKVFFAYFEMKPPPTGSDSRTDNWSLRDVTTCCQIVLASRFVLFGYRLKISKKNRKE